MPITRPIRALVLAVTSLILLLVLIFGRPPAVLALPADPEFGDAVPFARPMVVPLPI
jgi:hypothetical protein